MVPFDKKAYVDMAQSVFEKIPIINGIVDAIAEKGYKNVLMIGVGGSLAFHMQMESIVRTHSTIDARALNATEVVTTGYPIIGKDSVTIFHSRSGDTKELMDAALLSKERGATVIQFAEKTESPLAKIADYVVPGVGYYYLTLFYTYLMFKAGDYPDYPEFIENFYRFPKSFADDIYNIDSDIDLIGKKYAVAPFTYVVGAGHLWGWTYSLAMCVMEETMWMHTKSIHAGEFFHGTIEMIERDSYMLLLRGEDSSRKLIDRVENFANRVCENVTVLDTKACPLAGIAEKYREILTPIIMEYMCRRLQLSFEDHLKHPKEIRRYYRSLVY